MDPVTTCLLVPLITAVLCLFFWRWSGAQRLIGVVGAAIFATASIWLIFTVSSCGICVVRFGNWPAPFGISFVADLTSALMVAIAGVMGFAAALYALADIDPERVRFGFFPLLHFMLLGVCGAFLTADIFNMFVWFEVMLISSFVLMALGGERPQMEGAVKYVVLNLISSAVFLAGCGILYGKTGTLNLADLAVRSKELFDPGLLTVTAMLFLVAFGLKAGVFPLFFWLPASYHTPPVAVSAIFAGLLTKVGFYAMLRVFTLVFDKDMVFTHSLLLAIGILTMVVGVLGAVAQYDFRRLLSFHIVSQIGYMVFGLAVFTPLALAGTLYFLIHNILAKSNLYLISGVAARYSGTFDLKKLGGLMKAAPFLSVLFFIPAMSLAGIPPLSGFFAKFALIKAGLDGNSFLGGWAVVGAAAGLAVGMLTLFSMTKIWAEAFWKVPHNDHSPNPSHVSGMARWALFIPIVLLASLTLLIGLAPDLLLDYSHRAASQLLDPSQYIRAVLH